MKLLDEIGSIVQEADPGTLREVLDALGAAVVIRYERGRIGNRLNLPVSAELRLGAPLGELGEVGRGERRLTLLHDRRTLLRRLLGASRLDVPWERAVRMSGWRPPPRKRPPARYNATTFQVRRQGYRTVGEIAAAAGIPLTTFRRWMGGRLPDLPEHQGIKAVPESEFEHVVRVCKAARAAARARGNVSASDEALARGFARHGVCPSRAATAEVPPSAN